MSVGTEETSGRITTGRLRDYLTPGETVAHVASGTLCDDAARMVGTVGVTDDRVVFVSEGVGFMEVTHEAVASVQSRARTSYTRRGLAARLLIVGGLVLATVGLLGVVLATNGPIAVVLTVLAVGSVVALECVRRYDLDVDWSGLDEAVESRSIRPLVRRQDGRYTFGSNHGHLMVGFGVAAILAFAVLSAIVATPSVVLLALATLAGVAVTDRAYRAMGELDRAGESRRREREVRIHLVDGRVVRVRVDAGDDIDRALSTVAG